MGINKIQILSTKLIGGSLTELADKYDISIDEVSFIETEDTISPDIHNRIIELSKQHITAIFTSANAVHAVKKLLPAQPAWEIFCIGYQTKQMVSETFGDKNILGIADNGEQLAEEVIKLSKEKKIFFFCGNQRRKILPDKLKSNGIELEELIVYQTIETPKAVSKHYDGIFFFSPSGVRSFFSANTITNAVQFFAIGNTTANEIKAFTKLPVLISPHPDKEELVSMAIKHFTTIKTF